MRQFFNSGVYLDELAETHSDISRAAGFWGAARFQENKELYIIMYDMCANSANFNIDQVKKRSE